MTPTTNSQRSHARGRLAAPLSLATLLAILPGCATQRAGSPEEDMARAYPILLSGALDAETAEFASPPGLEVNAPTPDPRVGLAPGMFDAGQAIWNMRMLSTTPPQERIRGQQSNSDLAFTGKYAIQGNYNGIQVWDISDPANPVSVVTLRIVLLPRATSRSTRTCYSCPARTSAGPGWTAVTEPIEETVSHERLRGIRIFDISDIANSGVRRQTCRPVGARIRTRCWSTRGDDAERLHLRVRVGPGAAPRGVARLLGRLSPQEDPNTALCSASR